MTSIREEASEVAVTDRLSTADVNASHKNAFNVKTVISTKFMFQASDGDLRRS